MRFGSVCSGIEAASAAWGVLGWRAAWFSEIEPFPCAVLAHHYPNVPNHGDMTTLPDRIRNGEVEAPDVFCGGTPCQAFSVAGLRRSLDDARGNLSLTFCEIADAIDYVRLAGGEPASVVFWENVPGVLSTKDNAFGCFLARLCGGDEPLHAPDGWPDAGCVSGPARTAAWRVLDAQYFGLAQRRRRVFVVASARGGFDPAAVLLEFEGVRRDTAPSREAGQRVANALTDRADRGGTNSEGQRLIPQPYAVGNTLTARMHKGINTTLDENQTPVLAHSLRGEGFDASEDGTGRGTPLVPVHVPEIAGTMKACKDSGGWSNSADHAAAGYMVPVPVLPYTLAIRGRGDSYNLEYRQDGTANALLTPNGGRGGIGVGAVAQPVAFHPTQDPISSAGVCHAIGANANATAAVAHCVDMGGNKGLNGGGILRELSQPLSTNGAHAVVQATAAVAIDTYNQTEQDTAHTIRAGAGVEGVPATYTDMQVRRLTPTECERLQGFPDHYTAIPWRGKPASECPDGPRYKALGNSWAVPVVRWIGRRIQSN